MKIFIFCTVLPPRASKVDQNRIFPVKWLNFANCGVKTVHSRQLIMEIKVDYKVVSDNFYSDQNTVRCHLK